MGNESDSNKPLLPATPGNFEFGGQLGLTDVVDLGLNRMRSAANSSILNIKRRRKEIAAESAEADAAVRKACGDQARDEHQDKANLAAKALNEFMPHQGEGDYEGRVTIQHDSFFVPGEADDQGDGTGRCFVAVVQVGYYKRESNHARKNQRTFSSVISNTYEVQLSAEANEAYERLAALKDEDSKLAAQLVEVREFQSDQMPVIEDGLRAQSTAAQLAKQDGGQEVLDALDRFDFSALGVDVPDFIARMIPDSPVLPEPPADGEPQEES